MLFSALVDFPAGTEVIVDYAWGVHDDTPSIICECDTPSCSRLLRVTK